MCRKYTALIIIAGNRGYVFDHAFNGNDWYIRLHIQRFIRNTAANQNACTKACTQNLNVMQYIAYAQRGELEKCAEESFDCVSCGCCTVRCPAGISHPMVGLLARRLTGKYIEPESKHLTKRVEEIHEGAYDELIEQIMQKPITEMQELYNNREIEK